MTESERHVMTIFSAALDRESVEERAVYLDEACGADAALRERVEALLQAHGQVGGFLEARQPTAADPSATVDGPQTLTAGAVIADRYKLIEEIGEGGMGTVWMAQQTEPVKRAVAVKLIKPGMDSKQVLARFDAERQALALMDHPNIAKVLDAGTVGAAPAPKKGDADLFAHSVPEPGPSKGGVKRSASPFSVGRPFFVMDLVKGKPITKYCDEHRLTPRQRLELFLPVCQAVQHAHQKGIIHRDLKPSNILVASYDGKPVPKVIDFGVAKAAGQQLTDRTLMTGFGVVVGTLEYMSPEQAELNQLDVDTRSDVYSLGVVLYELLTGSTPLDKKRLKQAPFDEILRVIREEDPQKPSTRLSSSTESLPSISAQRHMEPAKLTSLMRGELDWIVMKALEKDRNRRYETANGLALDVQRYLADEPVLACPPSAGYRLRKFVRRHKGPVLAASVFVLLLMAGMAGTSIGLLRALAAEKRANAERDDKEQARLQTRQALNTVTDEVMEDLLGRQTRLTDQHREFLKKLLGFHAALAAARADDLEGRVSKAQGFYRVGRIRFELGELKDAEEAFHEALAIQKQLAKEFPDRQDIRYDLMRTQRFLGTAFNATGRSKEAAAIGREAVALGRQLVAESARTDYAIELAKCENNLGYDLLMLNPLQIPQEVEELWRHALALTQKLADAHPDKPTYQADVISSQYSLARLLSSTKHAKEAEEIARDAVERCEKFAAKVGNKPECREQVALSYMLLGVLLQESNQLEKAKAVWVEAEKRSRQLTIEFPLRPEFRHQLIISLNNLGMLYDRANRTDQAERAWGEAFALAKGLADDIPGRPDFRYQLAVAYHNVGAVLDGLKKWDLAEEMYHKAVVIAEKLSQDYPDRIAYKHQWVTSCGNWAWVLNKIGRPKEAETAWRKILVCVKEKGQASARYNLAIALERQPGKLDEAVKEYREALRINSHTPEQFYKPAAVLTKLAQALTTLGRKEEAIEEYRKLTALMPDSAVAHCMLGNALLAVNREDALQEAMKEYKQAIRIRDDYPQAHTNLGICWSRKNDWDKAIEEYNKALATKKDFPEAYLAHRNLGLALLTKGLLDDAVVHLRKGIELKDGDAEAYKAHFHLGKALFFKGLLDEAAAQFRKAIKLQPDDPHAHFLLGCVLQDQGEMQAALEEMRQGPPMGSKDFQMVAEIVKHCERLALLEKKLPDFIAGKATPSPEERLELAKLCQLKRLTLAATRFWEKVLADKPQLANDLETSHRYDAACNAALAGSGQGKDAAKLNENERADLRRLALDWLRADLAAWQKELAKNSKEARAAVRAKMIHWQGDKDFAGVRAEALAKLPEEERKAWQKLWDDVAATLDRAQVKPTPDKP
jgi:serine/threonine protein kinase/tetratricopeptide (TPR) repeat protein